MRSCYGWRWMSSSADGGPEAGDGQGDDLAAVHVAGVAQQPHPRVCPVLRFHRRRRRCWGLEWR